MRRLRDITRQFKETRKTLVILSPLLRFPPEVEKDITVLDYALPTPKEEYSEIKSVGRTSVVPDGSLYFPRSTESGIEVRLVNAP